MVVFSLPSCCQTASPSSFINLYSYQHCVSSSSSKSSPKLLLFCILAIVMRCGVRVLSICIFLIFLMTVYIFMFTGHLETFFWKCLFKSLVILVFFWSVSFFSLTWVSLYILDLYIFGALPVLQISSFTLWHAFLSC